ncbi:EamA family transporter [Patescibacteria group bacterium]|nr:EamA family transporter [Patescibacteria group bacterium]
MSPVLFAVLAAMSFGLWTVFHKLASPYVNQVFGAIIVSLTAVIVGGLVFFTQTKDVKLFTDPKGILFITLAGIAAFFIDFLALQAYSKGLPLTIGGPIIIGGSMAVAVIIGFLIGEPLNLAKIAGIAFIILGGIILATYAS